LRAAFFFFFLVSGFCSLLYQVVWLRLAMAGYGVNTAVVSIVLSVFMAGLAAGSWGAGAWLRRAATRPATALRLYAGAELAIGLSAFVVPPALAAGERWITASGTGWATLSHYLASGFWIAVVLSPFCFAMGATIPLALRAVQGGGAAAEGERAFSYLYLANVAGAALGTLATAFVLVELFGFRRTLAFAAALNLLVAAAAAALARRDLGVAPGADEAPPLPRPASRALYVALFATGLVSMAAEVVWVRLFTPYLGTMVYAFAALLAVYLVATFAGSLLYRSRTAAAAARWERLAWIALPVAAVAPLAAADPRLGGGDADLFATANLARLAAGIAPFSLLAGFLTPRLVDRCSAGLPRAAGVAYAVNVVGCILGPLLAGFVLLPLAGERGALVLLTLPLLAAAAALGGRAAPLAAAAAVVVATGALARGFETRFPGAVVRRDATATSAAVGEGTARRLLVNGVGMTHRTPITKMMTHLPLAFRPDPPTRGTLVVCLGMGTSLRSALSWGAPATAVELVPGVVRLAPEFHADAAARFSAPGARVVIDDGRRFLARSHELFDAIVIDPPPPIHAAGSSLLYSLEFYALAGRRLAPDGVLQQWVPQGDPLVLAALLRAVTESFPHVRAFRSVEGWGIHILASRAPLAGVTAEQLAGRLPPAAVADLTEWNPTWTPAAPFAAVLARELPLAGLRASNVAPLRDDRPLNEYFLLRRALLRAPRGDRGPEPATAGFVAD